jgi:2-polyprenyl-3-methyl-5-hydroxy-6-metoxy-1,4-benzoquinol methylase
VINEGLHRSGFLHIIEKNGLKVMKRNIQQLWDNVWSTATSREDDIFILAKEENCIRWQRIEKFVLQEYGSFNNLQVIEIGAGIGTNAALMAKRGATVTLLDYSENALKRASKFFKRNGLSAKTIKQDLLLLPTELRNKYDISMSFGLAEHFKGFKRIKIIKAHFDVLRKGGITFISVPNKYNVPYRIFRFFAEYTGRWQVGEEYPFSRRELRNICQQINCANLSFFGDSLFSSFDFINPLKIINKVYGVRNELSSSNIKREPGTFLDSYLSYSLVAYGKK